MSARGCGEQTCLGDRHPAHGPRRSPEQRQMRAQGDLGTLPVERGAPEVDSRQTPAQLVR